MKSQLHLLILTLLPFACSSTALCADQAERTNILFILTDDQRWNAPGCMGDTNIETPNIDRVAREGVRFNNAFYNCPQCTPSHASIVSGCYFWRCGSAAFLAGSDWRSRENPFNELPRFPHLLADSGYATRHCSFETKGSEP